VEKTRGNCIPVNGEDSNFSHIRDRKGYSPAPQQAVEKKKKEAAEER
jgi:hypothetical protein